MYWLGAGKSTFIEQLGRNRQSIFMYAYIFVRIHTYLFYYIFDEVEMKCAQILSWINK